MDNFFDIATPAELEEYYGYAPEASETAADKAAFASDPDRNLQHLFWLFLGRKNQDRADFYLNQIQDEQRKLDACMLGYDCVDP